MAQNKNPDANLTGFNTPEINSLLTTDNLCTMPHDLKIIFRILGQHNVECNFADWTIMSLQNINTRLNHVREDGQPRVVDFAILYAGACSAPAPIIRRFLSVEINASIYIQSLSCNEASIFG